MAPNTRRAYDRAWAEFVRYCHVKGFAPLEATPEQVADFLVWAAQSPRPQSTRSEYLTMGSLQVLKSAINRKFLDANKPSPTRSGSVDTVMRGLARLKGHKPRQVKALRERHIMQILEKIDDRIDGLLASDIPKPKISRLFRDASLISLGFAGALRRSELIELKVGCLRHPNRLYLSDDETRWHSQGEQIAHLRRSALTQTLFCPNRTKPCRHCRTFTSGRLRHECSSTQGTALQNYGGHSPHPAGYSHEIYP